MRGEEVRKTGEKVKIKWGGVKRREGGGERERERDQQVAQVVERGSQKERRESKLTARDPSGLSRLNKSPAHTHTRQRVTSRGGSLAAWRWTRRDRGGETEGLDKEERRGAAGVTRLL